MSKIESKMYSADGMLIAHLRDQGAAACATKRGVYLAKPLRNIILCTSAKNVIAAIRFPNGAKYEHRVHYMNC